jgi:hypothetical protein
MENEKVDRITLADAFAVPVWRMVWAGEPTRQIDVLMTYEDLKIICDTIQELSDKMRKE